MARIREFDKEKALQGAMMLFWQKGYEGASLNDIVEATGVSRYGLYDEFDSKKGLYMASLEHYIQMIENMNMEPILKPNAKVNDIRQVFENLITMHDAGMEHGCMFCHAANEMADKDDDVKTFVLNRFKKTKSYFSSAIQNSIDAEELPHSTDVDTLSMVVLGLMQGGATFARAGMESGLLRSYMHNSMDILTGSAKKTVPPTQ